MELVRTTQYTGEEPDDLGSFSERSEPNLKGQEHIYGTDMQRDDDNEIAW